MMKGIELRWDCRTEPSYHEVLQYRVQERGPDSDPILYWGEWTDVPYHAHPMFSSKER